MTNENKEAGQGGGTVLQFSRRRMRNQGKGPPRTNQERQKQVNQGGKKQNTYDIQGRERSQKTACNRTARDSNEYPIIAVDHYNRKSRKPKKKEEREENENR